MKGLVILLIRAVSLYGAIVLVNYYMSTPGEQPVAAILSGVFCSIAVRA
jgi:hypothetical protein